MARANKKAGFALAAALSAGIALGAGGHHDVDDANILAPGECSQETWVVSAGGGNNRVHAGANCRVGPVELGLAAEHIRAPGEPSATYWAPEVKWAHDLGTSFSVGFDLQPILLSNASPHYQGVSAYAIASWSPRPDLAFHANLGNDFQHGAPDEPRGGFALEWTPTQRWSFVAERFLEQGSHSFRAGARWLGGQHWSVDLSHAWRIAGPRPSRWTLGLNLAFGDD
jgi:hypothetical protein